MREIRSFSRRRMSHTRVKSLTEMSESRQNDTVTWEGRGLRFRVWEAVAWAYLLPVINRQRLLWVIVFWTLTAVLVRIVLAWAQETSPAIQALSLRSWIEWGTDTFSWVCVCLATQRFALLGEQPVPIPRVGSLALIYAGYLIVITVPSNAISVILDLVPTDAVSNDVQSGLWSAIYYIYICAITPIALTVAAVAAGRPQLSFIASWRLARPEVGRLIGGMAVCMLPLMIAEFVAERIWIRISENTTADLVAYGAYTFVYLAENAAWAAYVAFAYLHFTHPGKNKEELVEHFR